MCSTAPPCLEAFCHISDLSEDGLCLHRGGSLGKSHHWGGRQMSSSSLNIRVVLITLQWFHDALVSKCHFQSGRYANLNVSRYLWVTCFECDVLRGGDRMSSPRLPTRVWFWHPWSSPVKYQSHPVTRMRGSYLGQSRCFVHLSRVVHVHRLVFLKVTFGLKNPAVTILCFDFSNQ